MPAILFVCAANRIRSPLAEHLLRRRLLAYPAAGSWRVESAGVWAADGLPSPSAARQVAVRLGFDLDGHRSRRIEDVNLAQFDRIFTMERVERNTLRAAFPELAERIYMVSEAADGQEQNVTDPRATVDAVLHTARRLDDLIAKALPELLAMYTAIWSAEPAAWPGESQAGPAERRQEKRVEPAEQRPRRLRFGVLRRSARSSTPSDK